MSFWPFQGILGLFSPKRAPGDTTRIIFKNQRIFHFTPYDVVTSCKISEKYNGWLLRKVGADGRNKVNSKVSIPTKVRGPKTSFEKSDFL